jgi:hypothetical protein
MSGRTDLSKLLADEPTGPICYVDIYVQKVVSEDLYIVSDQKDHCILSIADNPAQGKNLCSGKCFRLMKPSVSERILTSAAEFAACQIKPFDPKKLTAKELKSFMGKCDTPTILKTLPELCIVRERGTLPSVVLKVLHVGADKQGLYSPYSNVKVKDINSNTHFISIFGNLRQSVKPGRVYKFIGFAISPKFHEPNALGYVNSCATSRIIEANKDICEQFSHIKPGDQYIKGEIVAHEEPRFYECCPSCQRSKYNEREGKQCTFCNHTLPETKSYDFCVVLVIADSISNDLVRMRTFRSLLTMPFNQGVDEVNEKLESLLQQTCSAFCDKDVGGDTLNTRTFEIIPPEGSIPLAHPIPEVP